VDENISKNKKKVQDDIVATNLGNSTGTDDSSSTTHAEDAPKTSRREAKAAAASKVAKVEAEENGAKKHVPIQSRVTTGTKSDGNKSSGSGKKSKDESATLVVPRSTLDMGTGPSSIVKLATKTSEQSQSSEPVRSDKSANVTKMTTITTKVESATVKDKSKKSNASVDISIDLKKTGKNETSKVTKADLKKDEKSEVKKEIKKEPLVEVHVKHEDISEATKLSIAMPNGMRSLDSVPAKAGEKIKTGGSTPTSKSKKKDKLEKDEANSTLIPGSSNEGEDGKDEKGVSSTDDMSKNKGKEESNEGKNKGKDGYQSPRAAAQVAKSRLSLSGSNKATKSTSKNENEDEIANSKSVSAPSRKSLTPKEQKTARKKDKDGDSPAHWVACDTCGKWRSLPGSIDVSALPERWYCAMNKWDSSHDDCSKEEEEYVEPDTASGSKIASSRSNGSLSGLDGEGGKKKDRTSRGESKGSRKRSSRADEDSDDDDNRKDGSRSRNNSRRRSKGGRTNDKDGAAKSSTDMVSWVQCNKCSKWRKVPSSIGSELPDVWYCSMNTWAPEYSKCSSKEEEDEKVSSDERGSKKAMSAAAAGRGKYARGSGRKGEADNTTLAPGKTVVKKIQWVQCERKNCKKWRKIPIEVDLAKLPDQWFCEMNVWDPERAACDLAEDSDDESDQPANQAARTQLILGNSKGPGTLSYRRLIFGADGRIRPFYSEKNKNGYGLFSFTEVFRPTESDEYIMPTRRIGYWSSSSFNGSVKPSVHVVPKKKKREEETEEGRDIEYQTSCSTLRPDHTTFLMDSIHRLATANDNSNSSFPPPLSHMQKAHPLQMKCPLFRRLQLACSVVQNYLLLFAGNPQPQPVEDIFHGLSTLLYFHDPNLERCRASMGKGELLDTLHRLDDAGTIEATYDNDGDLSFRLLLQRSTEQNLPMLPNPFPALLASHEPSPLGGKSVPLKMRKRKIGLQTYPYIAPVAVTVAATSSTSTGTKPNPASTSSSKLSDLVEPVARDDTSKVTDDVTGEQSTEQIAKRIKVEEVDTAMEVQ
jgi:hypothetical protein